MRPFETISPEFLSQQSSGSAEKVLPYSQRAQKGAVSAACKQCQ
jgi:hypothetical protein